MKKAATLKDIARETGVHVSTVSRALDPNSRVVLTKEVVERVRGAATRLGYRPNRLASALRTNRTMTVGLMLPDITNSLFPPIVRGVESVLEPLGYASIIVNTDGLPEREGRLLDVLRERGVDGIIHAAALRQDPAIGEVFASGTPVVTVNRQVEGSKIPSVVNDDGDGIRQIYRYLRELGHDRIAYIAGPEEISTAHARMVAFNECLDGTRGGQNRGRDAAPAAIVQSIRFDEAEGRRCAARLIDEFWPFTAILCANDRLALGAMEVLRQRGIDCPGDISVTGFNDIPFLDMIPPGLTTVRIQQDLIGRISAELLVQMMTRPGEAVPRKTVLPVHLIKRGSVAAPADADPRPQTRDVVKHPSG